jgi:hypothetical protein
LRTLPYLRAWYERYVDDGFEIIGVHTPEFKFARDQGQVKAAVGRLGIRWPVIMDNDQAVWTAYANRYWPTIYLIDGSGYIRYRHVGEGAYTKSEGAIQSLLRELNPSLELPAPLSPMRPEDAPDAICPPTTPELHIDALGNAQLPSKGPLILTMPVDRLDGHFYLEGTWRVIDDGLTLESEEGTITLPYHAASVNAVLSPSADPVLLSYRKDDPLHLIVTQDGKPLHRGSFGEDMFFTEGQARVRIDVPRLYALVRNPDVQENELSLTIHDPGLTLYAFSFGSRLATSRGDQTKE